MSNYLQEHRQGKLAVLFARKTYFFRIDKKEKANYNILCKKVLKKGENA